VAWLGREQAILSRLPVEDVRVGFGGDTPDAEARLVSARVGDVRVMVDVVTSAAFLA
jgi:exonuclease III